tara:strand:- start:1042 stop:1242 length:201 start_codon:yes stop_codon:yes gene_type:complete
MTFLRTLVTSTTITGVVGTAFYLNCDDKTKKKLEPAYEKLKLACPVISCPIFNRKSQDSEGSNEKK